MQNRNIEQRKKEESKRLRGEGNQMLKLHANIPASYIPIKSMNSLQRLEYNARFQSINQSINQDLH